MPPFYQNSNQQVSVVMPIYNAHSGYLKTAVTSILNQSHTNFELIVIEDPGRIDARPVMNQFDDDRIRYIRNKTRTSFAAQLNLGLRMAQSQYVARMDGDDWALPERLALQLRFMAAHPHISVLGAQMKIIDSRSRSIGFRSYPQASKAIAAKMRRANVIAHPVAMLRKVDVLELGGYFPEFGPIADYDLWCRMLQAGKSFFNLPQVLLHYRIHDDATKIKGLKPTLATTLEIKKRYFKGKEGWCFFDSFRFHLERMLLLVPDALVLKLFFKLSIKGCGKM